MHSTVKIGYLRSFHLLSSVMEYSILASLVQGVSTTNLGKCLSSAVKRGGRYIGTVFKDCSVGAEFSPSQPPAESGGSGCLTPKQQIDNPFRTALDLLFHTVDLLLRIALEVPVCPRSCGISAIFFSARSCCLGHHYRTVTRAVGEYWLPPSYHPQGLLSSTLLGLHRLEPSDNNRDRVGTLEQDNQRIIYWFPHSYIHL